jgi:glucokinase
MDLNLMLVGDVGGTHTRFATVSVSGAPPVVSHRLEVPAELPDLPAALRAYLDRSGLDAIPDCAVIAAAGPVTDETVNLTNRTLQVRAADLIHFGFERVKIINDFAALAFAADRLGPSDLHTIGPSVEGLADEPISIVGPGTGLGVSCLVRNRGGPVALATEGGHIGFAPVDNQQMAMLSTLEQRFGRVSVEHLLSGPGLEVLHSVLDDFAGRHHHELSAEAISAAALSGDAACLTTISLFCSILGAVAGDIALAHGARGGVLIGGGIVPKIERLLHESPFRRMFEHKGRMSGYMQGIPTKLIVNPDATLIGAARAGLEAWGPGANPNATQRPP